MTRYELSKAGRSFEFLRWCFFHLVIGYHVPGYPFVSLVIHVLGYLFILRIFSDPFASSVPVWGLDASEFGVSMDATASGTMGVACPWCTPVPPGWVTA